MAPSKKKFSRHKRNSERRRTPNSMGESKDRALPAYFEILRKKDVLNVLGAIERDVTSGKSIPWKKLLPAVREMIVNDETVPDCLNFAKELLGLYERHHCRDISMLIEIFKLLLFVTEPDFKYLGDYGMEFEKIFLCPYGKGETHIDLVWNAVTSANVGSLKLQLKFGMGMVLPYSSFCEFHADTLLRNWTFPTIYDEGITELESPADYEIFVRNGIIIGFGTTEICEEAIKKNIFCNLNPESRKRLCLILRMLELVHAIKLSGPDFTEHFIDCYRLLFDSIPAAFVTSVEVKTSLEKCLPVSCSRLISRITEDFRNILPELAEVPQPRSLKHLCRIEARQSLRRNLNLPHGVAALLLPTGLKQYIMLDDDGDYSVIIDDSVRSDPRRRIYSRNDLCINSTKFDDWLISYRKDL